MIPLGTRYVVDIGQRRRDSLGLRYALSLLYPLLYPSNLILGSPDFRSRYLIWLLRELEIRRAIGRGRMLTHSAASNNVYY